MSTAPANFAESAVLPPAAAVPPGGSPGTETSRLPDAGGALPIAGETWRGIYRIKEEMSDVGGARAWSALRIESNEEVILRAVYASRDSGREAAWKALAAIDQPSLERVIGLHEVGAQRLEVSVPSDGESLSSWRKGHEVDLALIEQFVRTIAGALGALHERGVVHSAVQPQHIFVREENGTPHFTLGGLHAATSVERAELVPLEVNPFYAPPEAAGLFQHSPGVGLCAWDWWSLGRVVQELVLGQHVLGHVLKRDVSRVTPELLAHAEALLRAHDTDATRAGGVEAMPAMEPRLDLLLRGLLTSARDGRWDGECVGRWLRQEAVREYYRLPRLERLFRWRDRAHTVKEAAEALRMETNWSEALEQVWELQMPGTLAHFLADAQVLRPVFERQEELRQLATAFALKSFSPAIVREVIAAVALMELAGGRLVWRGRGFDAEGMRAIFGGDFGEVDRLALLQAFAARPVALCIERTDQTAARLIAETGQVVASAEARVRTHRWMKDGDAAGRARLMGYALLSLSELQVAANRMRERYACSTEAPVEKLFKLPHPGRAELVALLWAADDAEKRGFLTHRQWAEREAARLHAAGAVQVTALAWMGLGRALSAGGWWFGRWRMVIPAWLLCAAVVAFLLPGPSWIWAACVPVVAACGVRLLANRWLRYRTRRLFPAAAPWGWTDGAARCRTELLALRVGWIRPELQRALRDINAELAKLTALQSPAVPVAGPPKFIVVWTLALAGWIFLAGVAGLGAWRVKTQRPNLNAFVAAWNPSAPAGVDAVAGGAGTAAAPGAENDDEESDGPVKVSWPFKPGFEAQVLLVASTVDAGSDQMRYLKERGKKFVQPYKLETISSLILFRVPTAEKFGVMLYDGQKKQPANQHVYLLDYAPMPRTWVEVAERKAIYIQD